MVVEVEKASAQSSRLDAALHGLLSFEISDALMQKIPLRNKKRRVVAWTLVDEDVFLWASKKSWSLSSGYASRNLYLGGGRLRQKSKKIYLHALIAKTPPGQVTDHKNGNRLDNRRKNLRICSQSKNILNSKISKRNSSGIKGVSWHKASSKWMVRVRHRYIGLFKSKKEAGKAYKKFVLPYV